MNLEELKILPAPEYHSMREYVSNSMLSEFLVSPAHLQASFRAVREPTPAMELGTLIHSCILEPETLERDFVISPKFDRRTKEGKAGAEKFALENPDRQHITAENHEMVLRIIDAVYSHDTASAFLKDGVPERSIFWTDEATGVKCRSRIDFYRPGDGILVDLKTTEDARAQSFQRSIANYGYHRQLAFYTRGLRAVGLPVERQVIVAVEKSEPFGIKVYEMNAMSLQHGEMEITGALARYAECLATDLWPAYDDVVEEIGLPAYAF